MSDEIERDALELNKTRQLASCRGAVSTKILAAVAGIGLLAVIPVVMALNVGAKGSSSQDAPPTGAELEAIESIVEHFRNGRIDEGENVYSNSVDPQRFSGASYERLLAALLAGQKRKFTKTGLYLYGQMLADIARYKVRFDPATFRAHARRLRQQAISRGDGGDLYFSAVYRLMEFPALVEYCPPMRVDLLDYHVLFGDRAPEIDDEVMSDRSHWDRALDHLPTLIEQQRLNPSPNLAERYHPLRSLARVHAREPSQRARELFKSTLGRLGDGSVAARERFDRWLSRAMGTPDEESWIPPGDSSQLFGYDPEIAMQLRNWLLGVSRYYRKGEGLSRGRMWIERALQGVDFGPHYLFKLDLALSIRDEANRLEAMLRDRTSVSGKDRVRQLYEIGWQSVRRGDREELRSVLSRLEDTSLPEVEDIRELLRGALHLLRGEDSMGIRRIEKRLDRDYETLSDHEIDLWRQVVERKTLPACTEDEYGHSLLTAGILWDDLREERQLEGVVQKLERNLSHANDLYYMQYLEALLAYRKGEVDGLADNMRRLLDLPEPPGVSRGDVAGLAAAVDSRVEDLRLIREQRERALDLFIPDVLRGVPDRSSVVTYAEILDWQIRMDRSDGRFLGSEEGRDALEDIMAALRTDAGLDYRIEEKRIELEKELVALTRKLREEGKLEAARETLEYSNLLGIEQPRYRAEEARILALEAERIPRSKPKERAEAWQEVAEAYRDAASTQFGNPELCFDSGRAFLEAGDYASAKSLLEKYVPSRGSGARGEQRYWWRIIHLSEIARKTGVPSLAIKVLDEITDYHGAETYWSRILLERASALDELGEVDEALAIFDEVLMSLVDPLSQDYANALYGKARVLQERSGRAYGNPAQPPEARREMLEAAHRAWENLCHKLPVRDGDPRLAESLYLAGVGWIEQGDYQRAREYFEQVPPAYETAKSVDLDPADLDLWRHFAVKSAHAHAEAFFLDGRYSDAIQMYQAAIATDPDSAEIALAYHQLGLSWFNLNDFQEAKRYWQLGRSRVELLDEDRLAQLPVNQDKSFWLALYDEKLKALDNPDRLRSN